MLLCKETKEVESYKDYWKSGGRFGSIPPEMMPGGAVNPFGRVNPRSPPDAPRRPAHAPAGGRPVTEQPPEASSVSTSSITDANTASSSSSPNDGFPVRPATPSSSSMGGVPMRPVTPSPPNHPGVNSYPSPTSGHSGMGSYPSPTSGMPPMLLDCEMITTAKKCFANPACSWIVDDSMWVCQETKEVETNKQFWRTTNMNQGHMPGPIPGTRGFGGMPGPDVSPVAGAFPQPPRRMAPASASSSHATMEGPTTIVDGPSRFGPGFNYQLQNILDKTNADKSHELSAWIYFFLASTSFLVGFAVVFAVSTYKRRSKATAIPDNFVRLGENRKV